MIRTVSFEAMLGQISLETAILDSSGVALQISSSGHLVEAALKELVACGLVYALLSVSGFTAVAFTGHALPTKTTEDHFTIGLCQGRWQGRLDFKASCCGRLPKFLGSNVFLHHSGFCNFHQDRHPPVALSFRAVSCRRLSPAFSRQLLFAA